MPVSVTERGEDRFSRVFEVLEVLVGHPQGLTLTEIVNRLGLPTSSAHNLLQRMVASEVVFVGEDLRYCIGARAVRLGIRIVGDLDIRVAARRSLQELARATGEDVYLAIRVGQRVSYVDRIPGTRMVSVDIRLGESLFLHATSVGKLFAAHHPQLCRRMLTEDRPRLTSHTLVERDQLDRELERIRRDGHAMSREEAIAGIVGIAAPVRDADGTVVGAVHVSALSANLRGGREAELIAAAGAAAAGIEKELGRLDPVPLRGRRPV